jgi:hypothetical protein
MEIRAAKPRDNFNRFCNHLTNGSINILKNKAMIKGKNTGNKYLKTAATKSIDRTAQMIKVNSLVTLKRHLNLL